APLIAPRFGQGFGAFGYSDAEVVTPVAPGSTYYNVTNLIQRIWTGSVWVNNAGGGGVPPAGSLEIQTSDNTGSSFVAIPNVAPGSVLGSTGTGSTPAMQIKPAIDVRDPIPPLTFGIATANTAAQNDAAWTAIIGSLAPCSSSGGTGNAAISFPVGTFNFGTSTLD